MDEQQQQQQTSQLPLDTPAQHHPEQQQQQQQQQPQEHDQDQQQQQQQQQQQHQQNLQQHFYAPAQIDLFTQSHSLGLPLPPNMYMPNAMADPAAMGYAANMFAATAAMGGPHTPHAYPHPSVAMAQFGAMHASQQHQHMAHASPHQQHQLHQHQQQQRAMYGFNTAALAGSNAMAYGYGFQMPGMPPQKREIVTTEEATASMGGADPAIDLVSSIFRDRFRNGSYVSTDGQTREAADDAESMSTPFSHSVPQPTSPLVYPDDSLAQAASSAGLPADSMTDDEARIFSQYNTTMNMPTFLDARNRILRAWFHRPTKALTLGDALHVTQMHRTDLCMAIYQYLRRVCAINYGLVKPPYAHRHNLRNLMDLGSSPAHANGVSPYAPSSSSSSTPANTARKPKTFLVIGAGAAGMSAARQIRQLFDSETDNRPPPVVIIIEARSRVGGRVYTHPLHTKARTSAAPTARAFTTGVDLGAKVVTGWDGGNPLKTVIKKQLKLIPHDVAKSAQLYDFDGKLIPEAVDAKGDSIFNQILDDAGRLKEEHYQKFGSFIEERLRQRATTSASASSTRPKSAPHASAAPASHSKRQGKKRRQKTDTDDSAEEPYKDDDDDDDFVMSNSDSEALTHGNGNGKSSNGNSATKGKNSNSSSAKETAVPVTSGKKQQQSDKDAVPEAAAAVDDGDDNWLSDLGDEPEPESEPVKSVSDKGNKNGKSNTKATKQTQKLRRSRRSTEVPSMAESPLSSEAEDEDLDLAEALANETEADIPALGPVLDDLFKNHPMFKDLTPTDFRIINWHFANLEFGNAAPLDKLSMYHWDQDDEYELYGSHSMIIGGYGQVTHALAYGAKAVSPFALFDQSAYSAPLPEPGLAVDHLDIRFDKVVERVKWRSATKQSLRDDSAALAAAAAASAGMEVDDQHNVEVECKDGSKFVGDALIVTLPLGVLKEKAVTFEPELPAWKLDSIKRLGFGVINKIALVFKAPFWDPNMDSFGYLNDPGNETITPADYNPELFAKIRGRMYIFWNMSPVVKLPVLIGFLVGQAATAMETTPDSEIVAEALDILTKTHPHVKPLPQPIETIVTRWSFDEYARGSYSYVAVGATGDDYDILAKPIGNTLYFAGEATCRQYPATVHGAFLSGMNAATSIANTFLGDVRFVEDRKYKRTVPASAEAAIRATASVGDVLEKNAIAGTTPAKRKRRSIVKTELNDELVHTSADNYYPPTDSGSSMSGIRRRRAKASRRYTDDSDDQSADESSRQAGGSASRPPAAWKLEKITINPADMRDVVCWAKNCRHVSIGAVAAMQHLVTQHMDERDQMAYTAITERPADSTDMTPIVLPMLSRRLLPHPPRQPLKNPFLIFTRIMWDAAKASDVEAGQLATRSELGKIWAAGDPEMKKMYVDEIERLKREHYIRSAQFSRQLSILNIPEGLIYAAGITPKEHGVEIPINFAQFSADEFQARLVGTDSAMLRAQALALKHMNAAMVPPPLVPPVSRVATPASVDGSSSVTSSALAGPSLGVAAEDVKAAASKAASGSSMRISDLLLAGSSASAGTADSSKGKTAATSPRQQSMKHPAPDAGDASDDAAAQAALSQLFTMGQGAQQAGQQATGLTSPDLTNASAAAALHPAMFPGAALGNASPSSYSAANLQAQYGTQLAFYQNYFPLQGLNDMNAMAQTMYANAPIPGLYAPAPAAAAATPAAGAAPAAASTPAAPATPSAPPAAAITSSLSVAISPTNTGSAHRKLSSGAASAAAAATAAPATTSPTS